LRELRRITISHAAGTRKAADLRLGVGFAAATLSRMLACFDQRWDLEWLTENAEKIDDGWAVIEAVLCLVLVYLCMKNNESVPQKCRQVNANFRQTLQPRNRKC
jgi:hypothetical protein